MSATIGPAGTGTTAHAIDSALHTGVLDDSQIPAAIARDSELHTSFVQADHDSLPDPHHDNSTDHANTNDPTAGEKAALPGTSGAPGAGNKYVTDADSRNTDSRAPSAPRASPPWKPLHQQPTRSAPAAPPLPSATAPLAATASPPSAPTSAASVVTAPSALPSSTPPQIPKARRPPTQDRSKGTALVLSSVEGCCAPLPLGEVR